MLGYSRGTVLGRRLTPGEAEMGGGGSVGIGIGGGVAAMIQTAFPGKTEHQAVPWEGKRWSKDQGAGRHLFQSSGEHRALLLRNDNFS